MATILNNHSFVALLLAAIVFRDVQSLPTSLLVDSKQQSDTANNKEMDATVPSSSPAATSMETTPNTLNKDHQKLHAQKRGVKSNFYDRDLSNDILVNNNMPNGGIWDDSDIGAFYPDLHEMEDYQPYQPFPIAAPYQPKAYENLQQMLNYDNVYDEPLALPVKYQYPRYVTDERRKRAAANKNLFRLKRDSTKMSTADMLALLALLETGDRNNRPVSDSDDANLALYYRMMHGNTDSMQDESNDGEWWNDLIEPSVQYYGNSYGHTEQNPRDRRPFTAKRYMISKKKRSLGVHKPPDHFYDAPLKSKMASGFDSRYSASQRF